MQAMNATEAKAAKAAERERAGRNWLAMPATDFDPAAPQTQTAMFGPDDDGAGTAAMDFGGAV